MDSNATPNGAERRRGTQTALTKFVQHRSQMLSLYWRVAGLTPFEDTGVNHPKFEADIDSLLEDNDGPFDGPVSANTTVDATDNTETASESATGLNRFCEVLVDYIAAGHFTLYDRITSGKERRQKTRELAEELYPRIASLTEVVIQFSDKYESAKMPDAEVSSSENPQQESTSILSQDLSNLGEALATRIELEDKLIDSLQ